MMNHDLFESKLYAKLVDVVGTEEEIKLRQEMFVCMDIVNSFGDIDSISVAGGSLAEGLCLKGSDEDIMNQLKNIDVVSAEEIDQSKEHDLKICMEMTKKRPGYASLFLSEAQERLVNTETKLNRPEFVYIKKAIEKSGGKCIVASARFRGQFIVRGNERHGPCVTSDGVIDFANCLKGSAWPKEARDRLATICSKSPKWIPSCFAKELLSEGCVYVPVGPKHFYFGTLWRVSFAKSEKRLVRAMNHIQILCYGLLKIVFKESIEKLLPDIFCSYFLKTCMFWVIEETDNDSGLWRKGNIYKCFQVCLTKILEWIEKCHCPNYFLPENNMFLNKVNGENGICISKIINKYKDEGYEFFSDCESLGGYLANTNYMSRIDREAKLDLLCFRTLRSYPCDDLETLLKAVEALEIEDQKQHHEFTSGVIGSLMSSLHQQIAQLMKSTCNNEDRKYILQKQKQHLQQGCKSDRLCGLILLASFHCTNKEYYTALEVLNSVTQKLAPDRGILVRRKPEYSFEEINQYKKMFCGMGYTLREKLNIATVRSIILLDNSSIVPEEFQPEVYNYRPLNVIPAAVYAYALQYICYLRTNNTEEAGKVLHTLNEIIEVKYLISPLEAAFSIACTVVGACYEEGGEFSEARSYYEKALNWKKICRSVEYRCRRLDGKILEMKSSI